MIHVQDVQAVQNVEAVRLLNLNLRKIETV